LQGSIKALWTVVVGASLLAMDVNDYAYFLSNRVVLELFASRLAPTEARAISGSSLKPSSSRKS